MTHLPPQALPISQKDKSWREQTVQYYAEKSVTNSSTNSSKQHLLKLYDFYNGNINDADYSYVLEPYGKKRSNFPARIRNYQIIKPNIDLLLGEMAKRPFNFAIIISDPDVVTVKEAAKNDVIRENIYQWFINSLNESGFDTGMESEEVELPEKITEIFERNWKDHRVKMAEAAIRYLVPYLHVRDKSNKGWFDFLVSGYVFSDKGVNNNEPYYDILNPIDVDYDKDPELDFIEDGTWATVRKMVHRSTLVDFFYKELTKEQVDRLQNPVNSNKEGAYHAINDNIFRDEDTLVEWIKVYWKSLKRVGIFTFIDEFGDTVEQIVEEEDYSEQIYGKLDWVWINEVWEGHRVDGDIYLNIKPLAVQRGSIDNPSKCKLPINGRLYSNRNSPNISLVEIGIPYQLTYNIFKFRLENAIGKSKDILAIFDINMIPEHWDMDKWMQMVDATGIAWQDYAKEGAQLNPQYKAAIDLSIKTIEQYIGLLQFIVEEWERVSGITRQRQGQTGSYEGKAVTEQSIIQSSHITEDYYRKYAKFVERELQGLLDYSQLAWVEGKKGMYVMPDGTREYLELDEAFSNAEYGLFLSDAQEELEKISFMKQLGQAAMQNGVPMSVVAEIINSDNFSTILDKIKKAEAHMEELAQAQQEIEQQMKEEAMQLEAARLEQESVEKELDRQNKIEIELIKQQNQALPEDNSKQEELNMKKQELEERKVQIQERLKSRELSEKERANRANEMLKRKALNKPKTTQ
jgi:hypothetical protein